MLNGMKPHNQDHIILSNMGNCFLLLTPEIVSKHIDLSEECNSEYIKQGTPQWHNIRKKSRLTGSTMYAAIGLDTLSKQKEHYYTYVCERSSPSPDSLLSQRLKHGSENEVNIIATLISTIMPAFLNPCFVFMEVGPKFITGVNGIKVEVSTDGIIMCPNGKQCLAYKEHGDKKIVIEMKSPYPTKENPCVSL